MTRVDDSVKRVLAAEYRHLREENERLTARLEAVVGMALCEASNLFLRPGVLYEFYPVEGCAECALHVNAYEVPPDGTQAPTQEPPC